MDFKSIGKNWLEWTVLAILGLSQIQFIRSRDTLPEQAQRSISSTPDEKPEAASESGSNSKSEVRH